MANDRHINYVILGLLSHESMTGYEIKKRMDTSLRFFWGASYGSIYPTLNTLAQSGLITKYETKENGRDKIIYTITEDGHEVLKGWLREPVVKDELRYETLLKLFFGGELGCDGSLEHIRSYGSKVQDELALLRSIVSSLEQVKANDITHLHYLLTARFGVKMYEACLEWCAEAADELKKS